MTIVNTNATYKTGILPDFPDSESGYVDAILISHVAIAGNGEVFQGGERVATGQIYRCTLNADGDPDSDTHPGGIWYLPTPDNTGTLAWTYRFVVTDSAGNTRYLTESNVSKSASAQSLSAILAAGATSQTADEIQALLASYVPLAGGTMTGQLDFSGTDHAGLKLLSLTTTERDALTPAEGMVIYNETLTAVQVYQDSAWVSVGSGAGGISNVVEDTTPQAGGDFDLNGNDLTDLNNPAWEVLTADTLRNLLTEADTALLNSRATGIRFGGALSDLGSGVIRIAAGAGGIIDNSDPSDPTYTAVTWAQTDLDLSATDGAYYIYVNGAGTVTSTTTEPSHDDYRTAIWLHRVSIRSNVYSASTAITQPLQQYGPQIWDVWRALGFVKKNLELSAASTNLTIAIAAGEVYSPGANFYTDPTNPHEVTYSAKSPVTFRHVDQDGDQGSDVTALDVGNYDNGGTLTAIPGASTRAQIFTVKMFPGSGGNVRIFYGQSFYNSVSLALDALQGGTYSPTFPAAYDADAVTLGWIIAEKGATNLADGVQLFITANKFGGAGGSVASTPSAIYLLASNNLSDVGDVATARANLGLAIDTDVQSYSAKTAAIDALTWAADKVIYLTGTATVAAADLTSFIRTLLDDADAATARATLLAAPLRPSLNAQTGTTYTFALTDEGLIVTGNNASAITFTIPPNSTTAFPTGTIIGIQQIGAGQITVAQGSGVTLRWYGGTGNKALAGQYANAAIRKSATDTWELAGRLA